MALSCSGDYSLTFEKWAKHMIAPKGGETMSELMTCPICGEQFSALEYVIADNGNPICPRCAEKEKDEKSEE